MPRLFALSFIWGWSFLFIQVAGQDLTPSAVAAGRTFLGAVVLLAVLRIKRIPVPRDRRTLLGLLFVGGVGSAIPFTLLAWGGQHIDSGLSAVLNASTPLFTAGLAVPLLSERAKPRVIVGLVMGFVGVAVVAGVGGDDSRNRPESGAAPTPARSLFQRRFSSQFRPDFLYVEAIGADRIRASKTVRSGRFHRRLQRPSERAFHRPNI